MSDTYTLPTFFIELHGASTGESINVSNNLVGFENFLTLNGYKNYLVLRLVQSGEEMELFLSANKNIRFRHGWAGGRHTNWRLYEVYWYEVELRSAGSTIVIYLGEMPEAFFLNDKSRSFPRMRVSDMFTKIIEEHAKSSANKLLIKVEPTREVMSLIQHNVSDNVFISEWLLPRARSAGSDVGEYNYYGVDGKEVHFHTLDSQLEPFKTYLGFEDSQHPVKMFRFRSHDISHGMSPANLRVSGYDPIFKKLLNSEVGYEALGKRLITSADKIPHYEGSRFGTGRYVRVPFKSAKHVEAFAEQMWSTQSSETYTATVDMKADPDLEPGRSVSFIFNDENGKPLRNSGIYQVNSILFECGRNGYDMRCIVSRESSGHGIQNSFGEKIAAVSSASEIVTNTNTYGSGVKKKKITVKKV